MILTSPSTLILQGLQSRVAKSSGRTSNSLLWLRSKVHTKAPQDRRSPEVSYDFLCKHMGEETILAIFFDTQRLGPRQKVGKKEALEELSTRIDS